MIFNKIYKISIFGAFHEIEATPDNMSYFLSEFGGQGFMPSIFQEIQISGINQVMKKRIALVSSNDSTKIMIGTERIDYEMVFIEDKRLSKDELSINAEQMGKSLGTILSHFNLRANRIAVNTDSYIICEDDEEISKISRQFTNPIGLYTENDMPEWGARLMVKKALDINEKKEICNLITNIDKTRFTRQKPDERVETNGFSVKADFNTLAENKSNRFSEADIISFAISSNPIWNKVLDEMG